MFCAAKFSFTIFLLLTFNEFNKSVGKSIREDGDVLKDSYEGVENHLIPPESDDTDQLSGIMLQCSTKGKDSYFKSINSVLKTTDLFKIISYKDININDNTLTSDSVCKSLVHIAAEKGRDTNIKTLIGQHASLINLPDSDGKTPIWYAVKNKHWSSVALLIRLGAKVTNTVYNLEEWNDLFRGEKYLKDMFKTSDLNSDKELNKLFFLSIVESNDQLSRFLINCGMNIQSSDDSHIWYLLSRGNFELVDYMISRGADIHKINKLGLTHLHKAALLDERKEILEFLISRGSDINSRGGIGMTPLDLANGGAWAFLKQNGGKRADEL